MPIYEYKCRNCDETFETFCSISERDKEAKCPRCGSTDTERKISSVFGGSSSGGSCGPALSGG